MAAVTPQEVQDNPEDSEEAGEAMEVVAVGAAMEVVAVGEAMEAVMVETEEVLGSLDNLEEMEVPEVLVLDSPELPVNPVVAMEIVLEDTHGQIKMEVAGVSKAIMVEAAVLALEEAILEILEPPRVSLVTPALLVEKEENSLKALILKAF